MAASRGCVFDRTIEVPFPFESPASGIGDTGFHPVVWYRRTVAVERAARAGASCSTSAPSTTGRTVWVNGHAVAFHEGGHTPVHGRHHLGLDPSGEQVVVVRAEDSPTDLRQPRGKQDWQLEPHAIWYAAHHRHLAAGVARGRPRDPDPRRCSWTPDVDHRGVEPRRPAAQRPAGAAPPAAAGRACARTGGCSPTTSTRSLAEETQRRISLSESDMSLGHSDLLWSPEHPNLIEATVTLLEDGEVARRGRELHRPARRDGGPRPAAAQRPPLLPAARPRPELLARVPPRRTRRRRPAPRGAAHQGPRLQRRPAAPEGRGPPLPRLVRPAGAARVGGDARRLRVLDARRSAGSPASGWR